MYKFSLTVNNIGIIDAHNDLKKPQVVQKLHFNLNQRERYRYIMFSKQT
jgi:hypothetical protein